MCERKRNTVTSAVARANGEKSVLATEEGGASTVVRILAAFDFISREQVLFAHGRRAARAALILRNR